MVKTPIGGAMSIEYINEDITGAGTYGTTPTNPALKWVGLVNPLTPSIKRIYEESRYLAASSATDKLQKVRNVQVGGEIDASLTYLVQDWTLMQYITGSATGLADTTDSLSFVQYLNAKWIVYKGCVLTKWDLKLPQEGVATVDVDLVIGDMADPSNTDPAGSGSHASETTTAPFVWKDITNLKMDANDPPTTAVAHNVGEIGLSITNTVELPKDVDSTMFTKAGGMKVLSREISASLELVWVDTAFYDLVKNGTKQNLKFTLGAKTFTVKGLIFPEWVPEMKPDELVGQTVTAIMDQPNLTIA